MAAPARATTRSGSRPRSPRSTGAANHPPRARVADGQEEGSHTPGARDPGQGWDRGRALLHRRQLVGALLRSHAMRTSRRRRPSDVFQLVTPPRGRGGRAPAASRRLREGQAGRPRRRGAGLAPGAAGVAITSRGDARHRAGADGDLAPARARDECAGRRRARGGRRRRRCPVGDARSACRGPSRSAGVRHR